MEERIFELPVALHFVAGFDGYFKKLSASWETLLGHRIEYLLSVPYLDLVHPDDRAITIAAGRRVGECAKPFPIENRYRHADGSYRWILWHSVISRDDELIYGVALEDTKRKEAELKLERTVEELTRVLRDLHTSRESIEKWRQGLVTICAWTKQVQHEGSWIPIDEFLSKHLKLNLTHGICDEAMDAFNAEIEKPAHSP